MTKRRDTHDQQRHHSAIEWRRPTFAQASATRAANLAIRKSRSLLVLNERSAKFVGRVTASHMRIEQCGGKRAKLALKQQRFV